MFKKYTKNLLEKEIISAEKQFGDEFPQRKTNPFTMEFPKEPDISASQTVNDEDPETIIGEKVIIKGYLAFERLLRIDGSFEGELVSKGKLVIGPTGSVKADINLQEAFISGKVEGNITVSERLVLRGRAEVRGDISAPMLSVDEGVTILGRLTVTSQKQSDENLGSILTL